MRLVDLIFRKEPRLMHLQVHGGGDQVIEPEIPILVCQFSVLIHLHQRVRNAGASAGAHDSPGKHIACSSLLLGGAHELSGQNRRAKQ